MKKIYLAGPLFSRSEVKERYEDERKLREAFDDISIFNPIRLNQFATEEDLKDETFFYRKDLKAITESNVMIADIDNNDPGTLVELGIYLEQCRNNGKELYVIYSNWKGCEGMNKFLRGAILLDTPRIFANIEDLIEYLKGQKSWKTKH